MIFVCLFHVEFFLEFFDSAAAAYELLRSRKEGMAGGADFHFDLVLNGLCFKGVSAGAGYLAGSVIRMNAFFHVFSPPSSRVNFYMIAQVYQFSKNFFLKNPKISPFFPSMPGRL